MTSGPLSPSSGRRIGATAGIRTSLDPLLITSVTCAPYRRTSKTLPNFWPLPKTISRARKRNGKPPGGGLFSLPIILMLGGFLLLWFWMGRGRRKVQQRRRDLLDKLKKGDKVVSIGGICGRVIEVKGDEITVKVDETSNVRMKFAKWGIRGTGDVAKAENMKEAQRQDAQKKP